MNNEKNISLEQLKNSISVLKDYIDNKVDETTINEYELEALKTLANTDMSSWQKIKLTEDNGNIKYITDNNLDIKELAPGHYACVASRFINPPIPNYGGYVDIIVRQNVNSNGANIRKTIIVNYCYDERTFIGYLHHDRGLNSWREITDNYIANMQVIYENEKIELYKKIKNVQTENSKTIGFITDTHYKQKARGHNGINGLDHMKNIVDICGNGITDLIVHGGDIIHGYTDTELASQMELTECNKVLLQSNVPVFVCKGNHDNNLGRAGYYGETSWENDYISNMEWNKLVTSKYVKKYGFEGDKNNKSHTWAYYDFEDIKLRCIMLDSVDLNEDDVCENSDGIITYDGSTLFKIGESQLTWLVNNALNFPSNGWSVMVFSHISWYAPENNMNSRVINGEKVHNLLVALKNHGSCTIQINDTSTLGVNFYGTTHKFVGNICGHNHSDAAFIKDGLNYIYCKESVCRFEEEGKMDPTNTEKYRTLWDPNYEDSWSTFTVDVNKRKLYLHRVGSGKSFEQTFEF